MKATRAQIIEALEYIARGNIITEKRMRNKELVDLAVNEGFNVHNINFDVDKWFHSAKRKPIEHVDFCQRYHDDETGRSYTCWY